jgi:hypothetical protein
MKLQDFKKLTKEHRAELALFIFTAIFDASFGIEKLMEWRGVAAKPGMWACVFLTLGALTTYIGYKNLIQDVKTDCKEKQC